MSDDSLPGGPLVPEELARWLAIVYAAPIARLMAAAEMPPTVESITVTCEGYPVDDDYVLVGTTVDVSITASNCAEIEVRVPGTTLPIRLRAHEPYQPTQTHGVSFVAAESGPIVVTAVNALGDALSGPPLRPQLHVLQSPEFVPTRHSEAELPVVDDDSLRLLAVTLHRSSGHKVPLDVPTAVRRSLTISAVLRDSIGDVSGFHSGWASRLRELLALHPRLTADAARSVQVAPSMPAVTERPRQFETLWVPQVPRLVAVARPAQRRWHRRGAGEASER